MEGDNSDSSDSSSEAPSKSVASEKTSRASAVAKARAKAKQASAKAKEIKDELVLTKKILQDEKTKFRKYRHKNKKSDLTEAYGEISKLSGKVKKDKMEELLRKYMEEQASTTKETVTRSVASKLSKGMTSSKHHVNYGDVCVKYGLQLFSKENDSFIEDLVSAKYITRKALAKTESKKLEGTNFPKSAHYSYFYTGKVENQSASRSSEDKYLAEQNLKDLDPAKAEEMRKSYWEDMSERTVQGIAGVVPQQKDPV